MPGPLGELAAGREAAKEEEVAHLLIARLAGQLIDGVAPVDELGALPVDIRDGRLAGHNPFELDEAIKFGLLFGVVVLIAKAAQVYLGDAGLYLAAGIAGLTDVDAITLAMADLAKTDESSVATAARAIVVAVMANTLTKSGMSIGLGSPELRRITLPISALLLAAGIAGALLV